MTTKNNTDLSSLDNAEQVLPANDQTDDYGKKKTKKKTKHFYKHINVNNGKKSFAAGLNIYKLLWVFVFGCVIGVLWETFYVYALTGELQRRSGMLYGPFNQVYGLGAVLFAVTLYRFRKKNKFVIFIASAVMGMLFEWVCSWVQEKIFGSVSWEYSEMATSIGGRTNLYYGVGWGVMGLIFLSTFWPWMTEMIERIPNTFGKTLTIICTILLAANLAVSSVAVWRYGARAAGSPASNSIETLIDETYPDEYMAKKYPSMAFPGLEQESEETQQT